MLVSVCPQPYISHHNFVNCGQIITKLYKELAQYIFYVFLKTLLVTIIGDYSF